MKRLKKPKNRKHPPFVFLGQYQAWIVGLLNWTSEEASAYVKKTWNVDDEFKSDGRTLTITKGSDIICVVFMRKGRVSRNAWLALLGHEVLHAILKIYSCIGQGVCTSDHEHLTYTHQHVFQGLLDRYDVQKRKPRR